MELALSLGEPSKPFSFLEKSSKLSRSKDLGFCMELENGDEKRVPSDPPIQLRFPWLTNDTNVNRMSLAVMAAAEESEEGAADSSPNSTLSSFQMDSGIRNGRYKGKREIEREAERASDDDDESNESTRKKLRLSKQQSVFLEESFKEHNTLNPKQKLALAKQLNLRPRQVEVWFQNRRARTKLKQTEVDCEYLKRSCETLTEENKRLQKELQDLRSLKTSHPFYTQHHSPATTLTMCPSCERVAAASATADGHARGYPPFLSSTCDPPGPPSPPGYCMKSLEVKIEEKHRIEL